MKSIGLVLLLALSAPACSHFSKSARQERAYRSYVRKSAISRTHQQARLSHKTTEMLPPEARETVQTSANPQSISSGQDDQ
jgi:hypothetical protein